MSRNLAAFVILLLAATPLLAQSTSTQTPPATSTAPVSGHAHGTMEHNATANNDTTSTAVQTQTKTSTTTTARTTRRRSSATRTSSNARTHVFNDATRLASLLQDVQTTANVEAAVWRTVVNEANSLANRIYGNTGGSSTARVAARDLRMHVREMRTAAMAGDAAGARNHASQALPFAYRLIDWARS